jgi:hypothetical protein
MSQIAQELRRTEGGVELRLNQIAYNCINRRPSEKNIIKIRDLIYIVPSLISVLWEICLT